MGEEPLPEFLKQFKSKVEPLLNRLEQLRDASVTPILYSMNRYIAKPDVDDIYEALNSVDKPRINVILFSTGGDPDQAYVIGRMLQEFSKEKLTVIVPRFAKSAGTLIACAADEIMMLPCSELGPLDPVIEHPERRHDYIPVMSLMECLELVAKKMDLGEMRLRVVDKVLERIPVTELGDYDRMRAHMVDLTKGLLARRMFKDNEEAAIRVAEKLCKDYKSHSAPITISDAREIGLKVAEAPKDAAEHLWQLHKLFVKNILEYEGIMPADAKREAFNFRVGKGLVFCVKWEARESEA